MDWAGGLSRADYLGMDEEMVSNRHVGQGKVERRKKKYELSDKNAERAGANRARGDRQENAERAGARAEARGEARAGQGGQTKTKNADQSAKKENMTPIDPKTPPAKREDALVEIRHMADRRRTAIRMPNGMLIGTYIAQALSDEI
jgi:hypothetical protein